MNTLRPYQIKAADAAMEEWKENQSTLIILPTGGGKTVTACEIIRRMLPGKTMFLAHREELIFQAKESIEQNVGCQVEIEMADMKAKESLFGTVPVVVSSIQTQIAGKPEPRMNKFNPDHFALLVCDESHHSVSDSWKRVIDYYRQNEKLKVLNLTATPDRLDEKALGQMIDTVAFDYEILDAINDGWLVNIEQHLLKTNIDWSSIRTTAGDLNGADLAAVMEDEGEMQKVVGAAIEIIKDRKTLVFASSVRHADMCATIFNRHRSGMAQCVTGKTPKEERCVMLRDFAEGRVQVTSNCAVLTEGFDSPGVEVIVMAKPTKSRSLYAQMLGRALRPLPGVVDGLESNYERKEAIAASKKSIATVLDFTGNAGKHKLMTSLDILGGKYSDEAQEMAAKKAAKAEGPVKMKELLEESEEVIRQRIEARRRDEEARKARLVAKVTYSTRVINPFDAFGIEPVRTRGWDSGKVLSEKQRGLLVKIGVNPDNITYAQGRQLIAVQFDRWNKGLCTAKQAGLLRKYGYDPKEITMKQATEMINAIKANNWQRPHLQPA